MHEALKDKFTQKLKFSHYLLTPMLMESLVKFDSPQNISRASQRNTVAAFFLTAEVAEDLFWIVKDNTRLFIQLLGRMPPGWFAV